MAVGLGILLRRRLSPRRSAFRLGEDQAILASIRGRWAIHMGSHSMALLPLTT